MIGTRVFGDLAVIGDVTDWRRDRILGNVWIQVGTQKRFRTDHVSLDNHCSASGGYQACSAKGFPFSPCSGRARKSHNSPQA